MWPWQQMRSEPLQHGAWCACCLHRAAAACIRSSTCKTCLPRPSCLRGAAQGRHERAGPFDKEEDAADSAWKLYLAMHQLPHTEPPPLTPIPPTAALNTSSSSAAPRATKSPPESLSTALASSAALKPLTDHKLAAAAVEKLPPVIPQHLAAPDHPSRWMGSSCSCQHQCSH